MIRSTRAVGSGEQSSGKIATGIATGRFKPGQHLAARYNLVNAINRNKISPNGPVRAYRIRYLSDLQSAPFAARDTPPQPWCGNNTRAGAIWLDRRV
jgi:hypothetical protein